MSGGVSSGARGGSSGEGDPGCPLRWGGPSGWTWGHTVCDVRCVMFCFVLFCLLHVCALFVACVWCVVCGVCVCGHYSMNTMTISQDHLCGRQGHGYHDDSRQQTKQQQENKQAAYSAANLAHRPLTSSGSAAGGPAAAHSCWGSPLLALVCEGRTGQERTGDAQGSHQLL